MLQSVGWIWNHVVTYFTYKHDRSQQRLLQEICKIQRTNLRYRSFRHCEWLYVISPTPKSKLWEAGCLEGLKIGRAEDLEKVN